MVEMLGHAFMQRAIAAGVLVGILCAVVGFFVVLRRLSFISVGLSHAAFGGVGLGLYWGVNPVLLGGVFATLVAWAIAFVSHRGRLSEDVSIGIFFSAAMAFGVAVVGLTQGYQADLFSYFFGNVLTVSPADLWGLSIVTLLVVSLIAYYFRQLLFASFDAEAAQASGVPVGFTTYMLLTSMALTVIITVKVVGIILASALLIIPAATGRQLAQDWRVMLLVSLITAIFSSLLGLWLSYTVNLPSGPSIVLTATTFFFLSLAVSSWRSRRRPSDQ